MTKAFNARAVIEASAAVHGETFTCNGCGTPTSRVDMSTYGARCRGCYESFCRAAFKGRSCYGSKQDKANMSARDYAAHRLELMQRSGATMNSVQTAFLASLKRAPLGVAA
jgi:hypothetical protein